jgi:hypothetical protein
MNVAIHTCDRQRVCQTSAWSYTSWTKYYPKGRWSLIMKREKLERVTIYLNRKEKRDAQIAAAHLELNMATLGRRAVQYLIYTPEEIHAKEAEGTAVQVGTESTTTETAADAGTS